MRERMLRFEALEEKTAEGKEEREQAKKGEEEGEEGEGGGGGRTRGRGDLKWPGICGSVLGFHSSTSIPFKMPSRRSFLCLTCSSYSGCESTRPEHTPEHT